MDLITLNPDTLQPDKFIENYESLIWTERYSENGDFELVTKDVGSALNFLPRETYVSLRESNVPMVVEDHNIEKKPREAPVITITGRSFETVLERRASVNAIGGTRAAWAISAAKESDAAYLAMRVVLGDVARSQGGSEVLTAVSPTVPEDAISEIDLILPADFSTLTPNSYDIKPDNLYITVMELVNTNLRGMKAVRPGPDSDQIGIEIYGGQDLSNEIVFDARFDQFDDATYLLSERGSTNVGYVYGASGSQIVLKTAAPTPSGLARRVLLVDVSGDGTTTTSAIRRTRGLVELYKYNATALFEGEISDQIARGYNVAYSLGDSIMLTGEYGLSEKVWVKEFIRTSDSNGEKAYPTLEPVT